MSEMKLVWMSFADERGFRGVVVLPVMPEEIAAAKLEMHKRFPKAMEGAEIVFAAMSKAHELKVNPGGQVSSHEVPVDEFPADAVGHLMLEPELRERGLIE